MDARYLELLTYLRTALFSLAVVKYSLTTEASIDGQGVKSTLDSWHPHMLAFNLFRDFVILYYLMIQLSPTLPAYRSSLFRTFSLFSLANHPDVPYKF